MKTETDKRHVVDILFVLALFLVFVVSSVLLIGLGASVYRRNVDGMNKNYTYRSSHAYLMEKVRSADTAGAVSVGELDGHRALLLHQTINDISYITYLYIHNGYLTELFCRANISLPASAGMQLFPLQEMTISESGGNAFRVDLVEEDGYAHTVVVALRSGQEAVIDE